MAAGVAALLARVMFAAPFRPPRVKAVPAVLLNTSDDPVAIVRTLFCRAVALDRVSVPAYTVLGPESVLAPESVSVLAPTLTRPRVPVRAVA